MFTPTNRIRIISGTFAATYLVMLDGAAVYGPRKYDVCEVFAHGLKLGLDTADIDNAGCDSCGTNDRAPGQKVCEDCARDEARNAALRRTSLTGWEPEVTREEYEATRKPTPADVDIDEDGHVIRYR